jgi:microcystin-dependent protein
MVDANYTMSNFNGVVDESRNQVLVVSGTNTAVRNLVAPLVEKTYIVKNSTTGGYSIQIIGASGLGVTIPNGTTASVYCDGTNFYSAQVNTVGNQTVNGNLAVTGTTALTGALTASTAAFSGAISSVSPTFTGTPTAPTAAVGTNTTQIATTAFVSSAIPTGVINMWGTGTAPTGWLLCNGASVSTTTYATLFAVIGYTFGGSGASFSLPNYTNRMPYGTTVALTGGTADAVVVLHTHTATVSDPTHSHSINASGGDGGGSLYNMSNGYSTNPPDGGAQGIANATGTGISVGISTTGVSGVGQNLPPYLGINFIIKT